MASCDRRPTLGGMAHLTIWHNQRCSKSRSAKDILTDAGVAFDRDADGELVTLAAQSRGRWATVLDNVVALLVAAGSVALVDVA